jgi:hypothetical protein
MENVQNTCTDIGKSLSISPIFNYISHDTMQPVYLILRWFILVFYSNVMLKNTALHNTYTSFPGYLFWLC